jgi:hypothetical protein
MINKPQQWGNANQILNLIHGRFCKKQKRKPVFLPVPDEMLQVCGVFPQRAFEIIDEELAARRRNIDFSRKGHK